MLLWLGEYLTQYFSAFNVFSYLTFRAIVSTLTALAISLYFGPKLIRYLQKMQIGQTIRQRDQLSSWQSISAHKTTNWALEGQRVVLFMQTKYFLERGVNKLAPEKNRFEK